MKITRNSRRHERPRVKGLIHYTLDSNPSLSHLKDICEVSESGLSFLTDTKIPPGTRLKASLRLLSREAPFGVYAIVLRCVLKKKTPASYLVSLYFIDMSDKDRDELRGLLLSLLKKRDGIKPFDFVIRLNPY